MLLFLCPNPCLDVYYYAEVLKEDDTTRVDNPYLSPGGKGVNAARVANRFCSDIFLSLPLGGCIGKCVLGNLEAEGINCIVVEVEEETRVNTILEQKAKGKHVLIASKGSPLSERDREKLKDSICRECSPKVLVLGGSVPPGLPTTYYREVVEEFKGTETKVIVDADGELLKEAVKAAPFAVKPNKHELERLVGYPLYSLSEVVDAAKEVASYGVEVVIVSLGEQGAVVVYKNKVYRLVPPKVKVKNTVGAGDSVVGGFACKIYEGAEVKEAVKFGIACGTATVMEEGPKLCRPEVVRELLRSIRLTEIA
ncbi:1-phosphofructokinase family hexose kinase [Thermovibrio sp.]